ncbi:beta-ketoacyl synthase chain length factor [Ralstonia soli]|uniref:Beta-ketoacyl synthase chain length factor n=1 Tax=Ralstonia soli TaxID=2953896 RepID=A0ABT1AFK9_9RALS|nr:beta-ketoacyl synthase chain length factor [Ralstonia soli]MCO5397184.1 beta-ketoacyl synthase chain length factor [Ralstonia soli]
MTRLSAFIESIGVLGPGLPNWPRTADVLADRTPYAHAPTELPPPAGLPSVERRRTGPVVKLALAVGHEAVAGSGRDAATLAAVFTSSGGDGQNCHAICETLASDDRKLSPTRFHNSVHNAPAGYWSIATQAMAPSNVLCAHDGSFAAGLLDGLCQVTIDATPVLLVAYDGEYPEPLHAVRPVPDAFAVALVLTPEPSVRTLARIDVVLTEAPATAPAHAELQTLWRGNAAARVLPLLEALAAPRATRVALDYLPDTRVQVDIALPDASGQFSEPVGTP